MNDQKFQELISQLAGPPSECSRPPKMRQRLDAFVSQLNESKVQVYPDDFKVLAHICDIVDAEPDRSEAWKIVNSIALAGIFKKDSTIGEIQLGASFMILNSTLAYLDMSVVTQDLASSVLVEIEDRVFLATTAHSIPDNPNGKLYFVSPDRTFILQNKLAIKSFAKDDLLMRDVAFIEVDKAFVETKIKKVPIPLSRLLPCGIGQTDFLTLVAGYPASEIKPARDGNDPLKLFTVQCWANEVLPIEHWNVLAKDHRTPDPDLDVFVPYPRDYSVSSIGPLKDDTPDELAPPFGMSGGGYWQPNDALRNATIWSPDYYSLIAIQSRWWGLSRYLQATQIIHWIRLVWEYRPELRKTLEDAFPGHDVTIEY
jgi:hypothetical protein